MKTSFKFSAATILAAAFFYAPVQAQAGLFDDAEARRAILDIRERLDSLNARVESKADKTTNLTLAGQSDQLRQEIASLRGQIEVLSNDLANTQKRQKDFYSDLDSRLRKLEPRRLNVDGREVDVESGEQEAYDAALGLFKAGDYKNASTSFSNFLRSYPRSGFTAAAHYWLGNTYYAQRDYRNAIASQQTVFKDYPENPKAPDALLNIASCYSELRDKANAKKYLEMVVTQYPNSPAAQTARERLSNLR